MPTTALTPSAAGGQLDLWLAHADGQNAKPLTADPAPESHVCVVPGRGSIVYLSTKNGRTGIWRHDLSTGRITLLTDDPGDDLPVCAPDGRSVIFTRNGEHAFRVGIDGGAPQPLPGARSFFGSWAISPDGREIVSAMRVPGVGWGVGLWPIEGGEWRGGFNILNVPFVVRWAPSGDALTYIESRQATQALWNQPLAGGAPHPLLDMHGDRIFNFAWSREGRLAVSHGRSSTDVVLFSGAQ